MKSDREKERKKIQILKEMNQKIEGKEEKGGGVKEKAGRKKGMKFIVVFKLLTSP